jgi:hypothetical protein
MFPEGFHPDLLRCQGDTPMDAWLARQPGGQDFPSLLNRWMAENSPMMPTPAESRTLRAAADFFSRHRTAIFLSLGFLSLPYCYAAVPGVQVLYLSQRFREQTRRRLAETARFVELAIRLGTPGLQEEALRCIQGVRLGHALFRRAVAAHPDLPPGVPVNQEDMAGTHLAFSYLVLRGLRIQERYVTPEEAAGWLEAWAYIGSRLGIDPALLPRSLPDARTLTLQIEDRHFGTCAEGRDLATRLMDFLQSSAPALPVPALLRLFLGDRICGLLGLPSVPSRLSDRALLLAISRIPDPSLFFAPGGPAGS